MALASVVLALLVAEVGVRVWHPMPFLPETNMIYLADPETGYRLAPDRVGRFGSGSSGRAGSQGLRNREVGPKPAGTIRVLVLGDSFTIGSSVEENEAYPQVLEQILARTQPLPVEVVNAGVGGWDPFQYAQSYAQRRIDFAEDLVVVGFFVGNDAYSPKRSIDDLETAVGGRRITRAAAARPGVLLEVKLLEYSQLARALRPTLPFAQARTTCADFTDGFLAIQQARLPNHRRRSPELEKAAASNVAQIVRIRDLAAQRGVPVVVALLPDETQVNPLLRARLVGAADAAAYDYAMPQSLLQELFERNALPVIDLLPRFLADDRCLYNNTTHWNPEGHALAASELAVALRPWL
jgi:lysophospholipase L1-like esterase